MAAMAGKLFISFALISSTFAASSAPEALEKEKVAVIGGNVTMGVRVSYPIQFCSVNFPGADTQFYLNPDNGEMLAKQGFGYNGDGFDRGICGIYIRSVEPKHNGEFKFSISPPPGEAAVDPGKVNLVVAQAPKPPIFYPPIAQKYDVGQTLATQCIIREGRPRPNIRWFLDDEILIDGLTQPIITGDDLLTVTQNLTRRLSISDLGKTLRCVADHIAINQKDSVATAQIRIQFAPTAREDPVLIYGIKIGEAALINVTIQASPAPTIEWVVASERISEGNYGRLQTYPVVPLGNGFYNATLAITTVEREDTDRDIELRARNSEGERTYNIKISTLGEPEGVDLGVGGIVGIVIAVLFLLITVFLIVFAKATNRWCFGGGTLRTDIPDTGDSEAPLPGEKGDGNIHVGAVNPSHEDYIPNGNGKTADIKSLPMEKPDTAV